MSDFTPEEINAAVEQLVQSTISRPYDTLGVRRADITFIDIQQAAAGVFLLYPKAPFYCLSIGAQNLQSLISAEAGILDELLEAVNSTGRHVLPIADVSPLFNAKAALQSLGSAALARTSGFSDIKTVPSYQRFASNIDTFLNTSGQAVKEGASIVSTPQQAVQVIPGLVTRLSAAHAALVAKVTDLINGQDDYAGLNLSALVAQSVIAKATTVLGTHADALQGLLPEQRLASIRQVVLDCLAAKAVVTTFGSFSGPTDNYNMSGTGFPYSDANHPAVGALALASIPGPYNTQSSNNILDLYLDGAGDTPRSLTLLSGITPFPANQAHFTSSFIGPDVLPGDVVYVTSGLNTGTKWTVLSIHTGYLLVQGIVAAQADVAVTVEILPTPSASIGLPYAYAAQITGVLNEQSYTTGQGYIIGNGTNPVRPTGYITPTNNLLKVNISGVVYSIPLTLSADGNLTTEATPRTAQQICNDINAVLNAHNYKATPYLAPRRFYGQVIETSTGGATATFDLLGGFGNFGNLSINPGDIINALDGDNTQLGLWTITAVTSTRLTATKQTGTSSTQSAAITIEVGAAQRRIQIVAVDPHAAVASLTTLSMVDDNGVATQGGISVGLSPGGTSRSRYQTAKEIAATISRATSLATASAFFTPLLSSVSARTNSSNAFVISLSKLKQTVTSTFAAGTVNLGVQLGLSAGVLPGDLVMERTGANPGTIYSVVTVTDLNVTATLVSGVGSSQSGVQIEIGPSQPLNPFDMIRIETSSNQGDVYVSSQNGLDYTLTTPLSTNTDPTLGTDVPMVVSLGRESLQVGSANTTTTSKVKARGSARANYFSTSDPGYLGAYGTSVYFKLPQVLRALSVGDLFQRYTTQYNDPSSVLLITAIETDIITLSEAIPSNISWVFGPSATVPFARLHTGHVFDFGAFQAQLQNWVAKPEQQTLFFTDLNRLINPLTANTSPTASAIGDALNKLHDLYAVLNQAGAQSYGGSSGFDLQSILLTYSVEHQPAVDALLRSFKEKGADRALDLILSGHFQDFFGLTPETSSYAGNMQAAAREVAVTDLSINKTNRRDQATSRLLARTQSPDPDYNLSDTESAVPDPVNPNAIG